MSESGEVRVFSRNQEDTTEKFPDIVELIPTLLSEPNSDDGPVRSLILDCEAVAFDTVTNQILPFQRLSTRKRKVSSFLTVFGYFTFISVISIHDCGRKS